MRDQACQHMVAVLPYRFGDDQRSGRRDGSKNFHAVPLAADESVADRRVIRMAAPNFGARVAHRAHHDFFHALLSGPAFLVGGESQVAACDQNYRFGHGHKESFWHGGAAIRELKIVERCL
jgi:hypothetical protein